MRFLVLLFVLAFLASVSGERLKVKGDHFTLNGEKVFLSGGNLPWINYAKDFGNGQWWWIKWKVQDQMKKLRQAGGNTMRLWIHIQGETSPKFDNNGYVVGTDDKGSFINEFKDMLKMAKDNDILVIPTLWSNAVNKDYNNRLYGLVVDWRKLQSYIDKVLRPLVREVKGHPALGAWDILNEPEGMIKTDVSDGDKCYDTRKLAGSGAGWAAKKYDYRQLLRFISWQADAIHSEDPGALVTTGVWNPRSCTDGMGLVNHYSDDCLRKAGQRSKGTLDFFTFHTYSWDNKFDQFAPFKHSYWDYKTDKPIVVGEFWREDGGGMTSKQMFEYVYWHGYSGAWSWDLVGHGKDQREGIKDIKNNYKNGKIYIDI